MNLMESGITRETSATKTSLDLCLTKTNKNQCSRIHQIQIHQRHYGFQSCSFCLTKNMIKRKIKTFKHRSMSFFSNKTLFEKINKKEMEKNLIMFQNKHTDQTFNAFCNCLHSVVDKYQPLVKIKQNKNRNQRVTNRLKMFFEEKQRKNKMAKDKNNLNKNRYLQLKSKSTQFKNDAKKSFIQNNTQNCGGDSRKMYTMINKMIGRNRRSDVNYNIVFNNNGTDDPSTKADYFNERFVNNADEIVYE